MTSGRSHSADREARRLDQQRDPDHRAPGVFGRLLLGLLSLSFWSASAASAEAPNIVLVVADDLGWHDVGFRGSPIETPHLDRIAEEGVQLDRFYVQPACSPTRAALMTGKSPLRLGILRPIAKRGLHGLPLDERILPQLLRDAGYQTLMTGKWHLGHALKRYFPHERGFDHFYGHVTGGIGYWDHNHGGGHDWQRNGVTLREDGYATHLITDEALALLADRDRSRPTFLYVAYNAPHLPNEAPEEAVARYAQLESESRRVHAAMVSEMDGEIGRLLAALESEGMRDQTLVWFLSDNGGLNRASQAPGLVRLVDALVWLFGEPLPGQALEFLRTNTLDGGADNAPLRRGKMSVYEGGTRVPAAIWWPGRLEGGSSQAFVTAQDVLPTILDAAGLGSKIPDDVDGASRWPTLMGNGTGVEPPDYLTLGLDGVALYRGPWKIVLPSSPLPFASPEPELYRVYEDPLEQNDLASEHPGVVAELSGAAESWPRGPEVHASLLSVLRDPDRFGGPEDREPWAEVAR
jgi:arylsulfatase A-like enzyme